MNKPHAKLIGANSNIFNLMAIATNTLKDVGLEEKADDMKRKIFETKSFDEAIMCILEYVTPVSADKPEDGGLKISEKLSLSALIAELRLLEELHGEKEAKIPVNENGKIVFKNIINVYETNGDIIITY